MEVDLIAKWTTDASEVELLTSLGPATHPRYRNSVIPVTDIIRYRTLGAYLIMPACTLLASLFDMTPTDYRQLRIQIIEVGASFALSSFSKRTLIFSRVAARCQLHF